MAEVCRTGTPFGYSTVDHFKETGVLERFIEARLSAVALDSSTFSGGGWIDRLDALLASPRRPVPADGADRIADFLIRRLAMEKE